MASVHQLNITFLETKLGLLVTYISHSVNLPLETQMIF